MPNQTNFVLEADAAKAVQEFLKLRDAEKKVDEGQRALAGSARTTEAAVVSAAKGMAREYEFAGERMSRALPLPRTFGGTYVPRTKLSAMEMASLPSSMLRSPAASIAASELSYATRGEGLADENLQRFNRLLARGNELHEKMQGREQFDFQRRTRNLELYQAKQQAAKDDLGSFSSQALAAAGSMALVGGAASSVFNRLNEMSQNVMQFEDTMRPLLSLSDNLKIAPQLRQQVLNLSTGYGVSTGDVASGSFMLQSAASNFSAGKRNDILTAALQLTQVTGGNFQSGAVAITKLMQDFGNEMVTANRAASALVFTEDKAAITIDQLSELLPDVLPAAKALGYSFNDISAATIVATQSMGNNEKTLTAERNMFIELAEAVKKGVIHQGTFLQQAQELRKLKPAAVEGIFGKRTFPVVEALLDRLDDLKQALKDIGAMEDDYLGKKSAAAWSDPGTMMANVLRSAGTASANFDAGNDSPSQTKDLAAQALSKYGARKMLPNWAPQWVSDSLGMANYIGSEWLPDKLGMGPTVWSPTLNKGIKEHIKTLLAAKNYDAAYAETVTFGKYTGSGYYDDPKTWHFKYTGGREAIQLSKLREQGYDLTPDQFDQYLSLKSTGAWGPTGAKAYLEGFHHAPAASAAGGGGPTAVAAAGVNMAAATTISDAAKEMGRSAKSFRESVGSFSRGVKDRNRNIH